VILEGWFASGMGKGYVSSLSYARVLPDTFTLLVPYAVGVSIYPFFSDLAARGDRAGLTETLMGALRIIAFAAVPLTVGMVLLRVPIVQLAFQRGQFSAESVALTAAPLGYYTCGLTAFAMEIILMQFYFSMKDTRTPVVVGIIALGVHVMVIVGLKGALLHSSIALAAAVSKTLKVGVLYALLRRKGMDLQLRRSGGSLLKMLAAAGVMGAAIGLLYPLSGRLFGAPADASAMRAAILLVRLGAVAAAGVACYSAAAAALRIDELSQVRAWVKARVLRRGRREV
jgi:putative peptidoglycan lipid II flippase